MILEWVSVPEPGLNYNFKLIEPRLEIITMAQLGLNRFINYL
jgi:hypothetical protein